MPSKRRDTTAARRFLKRAIGTNTFRSAAATLAGIETVRTIRKGQLGQIGGSPFKQFATTDVYFAMLTLAFAQLRWSLVFQWGEVKGS